MERKGNLNHVLTSRNTNCLEIVQHMSLSVCAPFCPWSCSTCWTGTCPEPLWELKTIPQWLMTEIRKCERACVCVCNLIWSNGQPPTGQSQNQQVRKREKKPPWNVYPIRARWLSDFECTEEAINDEKKKIGLCCTTSYYWLTDSVHRAFFFWSWMQIYTQKSHFLQIFAILLLQFYTSGLNPHTLRVQLS